MSRCPKVPAAAWRLLAKAEWPALKKAYFAARLGKGGQARSCSFCIFVSFFCSEGLISSEPSAPRGPGVSMTTARVQKSCWAPWAAAGSSRKPGGRA